MEIIRALWTSICLVFFAGFGDAAQHFIKAPPEAVNVTKGSTLELPCTVGDLHGRVQWLRNSYAMGFNRGLPGYDRYKIIGNESGGEYVLQIKNVGLDDNGEFECQVSPARNNSLLRAKTSVNVLLPPEKIEITNADAGGQKEANVGEEVTITCKAFDAKPVASIKWFRNGNAINPESEKTSESDGSGTNLKSIESSITLKPTSDDNGANYSCQAEHEALGSKVMSTAVTLDVFYPPGRPHILGMDDRPWVRAGELVTLECRSVGGNPPAELIWYKEGQKIDSSYNLRQVSTRTHSVNVFTFNATKDDDRKEFQCRASSRKVNTASLVDSIKLVVYYEPEKLQISGKNEAKINETVVLTCESSPSNPPTKLKWVVDGQPVNESTVTKTPDASGGINSSSTASITIGPRDRNLPVACYGSNEMIAFSSVTMVNILVIRPPTGPPEISGYDETTYLIAGTELVLNCVVMGGYPTPTLKWYFNDVEIAADRVKTEKSSLYVTADLKVELSEKDNGGVYRCEVTQAALANPKWVSRTLKVKFPPREVKPKVEPAELSAGAEATLTCRSSNSNPAAILSWLKNGELVPGGSAIYHQSLLPGHGIETELTMKVNLTHDDDGAVFTCEAFSKEFNQKVHDGVTLSVQYKPEFPEEEETVTLSEGESKVVNVTARANPKVVTYTWKKGKGKFTKSSTGSAVADGPLLEFTNITREDAGAYTVTGKNAKGKTTKKIKIDVNYSPTIEKVEETLLFPEHAEEAKLVCSGTANPAKESMISWTRDDYDLETRGKFSTEIRGKMKFVSTLTIFNLQRSDTGIFYCVAKNGIGEEVKEARKLVVEYGPVMDTTPQYQKAASDIGSPVTLKCRATGAPSISFIWEREGEKLSPGDIYSVETKKFADDLITWDSELTIASVKKEDFGSYMCLARNSVGDNMTAIHLNRTSAPDAPRVLEAMDVTHESITIKWEPGFDGGYEQSFVIKIRRPEKSGYSILEVNGTDYTFYDLLPNHKYFFDIKARNIKGDSEFLGEITATTRAESPSPVGPPIQEEVNRPELSQLLVIGLIIASVLIVAINISVISCIVNKRRRPHSHKQASASSDYGPRRSSAIQMYTSSYDSYPERNDTVSYTSEKSQTSATTDNTTSAKRAYLLDDGETPHYSAPTTRMNQTLPKPITMPRFGQDLDIRRNDDDNQYLDMSSQLNSLPVYANGFQNGHIGIPPPMIRGRHLSDADDAVDGAQDRRPIHLGTLPRAMPKLATDWREIDAITGISRDRLLSFPSRSQFSSPPAPLPVIGGPMMSTFQRPSPFQDFGQRQQFI